MIDGENQAVAQADVPETPRGVQVLFSVYTASNGYEWTNIPEGCDREVLDFYYQKAAALMPDFMSVGDVVKGVFAQGGYIAAFRIQTVPHWDTFGRSADYCAFAFMDDYRQAEEIDFEALLESPEFTEPSHTPPSMLFYRGMSSKKIDSPEAIADIKALYQGESLKTVDFSRIGSVLAKHGRKAESWLFTQVTSATENVVSTSTGTWLENPFSPPPPPPALPSPTRPLPVGADVRSMPSRFPPRGSNGIGKGVKIRLKPSFARTDPKPVDWVERSLWIVIAILGSLILFLLGYMARIVICR